MMVIISLTYSRIQFVSRKMAYFLFYYITYDYLFLSSNHLRGRGGVQCVPVPHEVSREHPMCQHDDTWHTLFECLAFQQFWEEAMTTLQEKGV